MSSIHNQTDIMLLTEYPNRFGIHRTIYALSMMQSNILLTCFGTVVKDFPCLLQHFHSLAAFRCSSEYQYHR